MNLTFSFWEPDVVRHEIWNLVVHLVHQLEDIVNEKNSVIITKDEPLVVLGAYCEVAQKGSSSGPVSIQAHVRLTFNAANQ